MEKYSMEENVARIAEALQTMSAEMAKISEILRKIERKPIPLPPPRN